MWVQPVPSVSGPTPVPWAPGQALSLQQTPPSQSWSWAVPPDNQGPGTTFRPESRKPQDPQEDAVRPQALEATCPSGPGTVATTHNLRGALSRTDGRATYGNFCIWDGFPQTSRSQKPVLGNPESRNLSRQRRNATAAEVTTRLGANLRFPEILREPGITPLDR